MKWLGLLLLFTPLTLHATTYSVCSSGCDYTTIAAAYAACAASGDIIELRGNITESVNFGSAKICRIQGDGFRTRTWDSDGVQNATLRISATAFDGLYVYGLIIRNTATASGTIRAVVNMAVGVFTLDNCLIYGPTDDDKPTIEFTNAVTTDQVIIKNCDIVGDDQATKGIQDASSTLAGAITVINCIIRDYSQAGARGYAGDSGSTNQVFKIYNCIFDNCTTGVYAATSTGEIKNCIFTRNTADVGETTRTFTITYSAFSQLAAHAGTGNVFGINTANQFVSIGSDYHVKAGAAGINAGVAEALSSPDKDGVTRADPPDMGPYEYIVSNFAPQEFILGDDNF